MSRRFFRAAVVIALVGLLVGLPVSSASAQTTTKATAKSKTKTGGFRDGQYIVTFADEPVASYDGYEPGFAATRPQRGRKVDPNSTAVQRWQQHLRAKHDREMAKVGATKLYDYTVTNNGVAAFLTKTQAEKLAKTPGIVAVTEDRVGEPTTTLSPQFLGLDASDGLWSQLGGADDAGAGVVVGVIDTGIWPESAAFAGGTGIPIPEWHGQCVGGEKFPKTLCNDKLIGARFYLAGFGIKNIPPTEYRSARDGNGHGTHTASTAAGNHGTNIVIDGNPIGTGSGMAPGAKVAAYKVCWEGRPNRATPGCFNSDSIAAVNDAVLDGVDVINFSIGGSSEGDILDPLEQAFRAASNAGVYVAASAGNSGPGASTFDHVSPWVTTVAAATHRRAFQAIELGNGERYVGASTTPSLTTPTSLVTSVSVKLATASDTDAALCAAGSLDPAKAAGKFVQCDRGVVDRIEKSFEVQRAGGVGMVMTNVSPNSINGDYHPIPSVHVDEIAREAILGYIETEGEAAMATIEPLTADELAAAPDVPEIAAFSSRGPSVVTEGDFLKPDIAAPGVDVVAAVAPPFHHGRDWDFISGTSMASPHIAGIGALISALHPDWTPSEIKSALMTTTRDTVSSADDPFAQGAGFVNPNAATDPGLVYPTTPNEYRQYLVSLGVLFAPPFDTLTPITASNLNQASIAVGKLAGSESVTRRVKNVDDETATYTSSVDLSGFDLTVSPSQLTLAPGEEATFTVELTRTDAALNEWAIGSLTWSDGTHDVRSPIAVQPVVVSAPDEVHGDASESGSVEFEVTPGFTGELDVSVAGLVGVTPIADSVSAGEYDINAPVADADTKRYDVVVPAGTEAARFSLDSLDDTADLDLFVYLDGDFVDLSASGAADEEVTLVAPQEGTYAVYVNGFTTPGGSTAYELANFVVAPGAVGNATVTPDPVSVTVAEPVTLTASWMGLSVDQRWFGVISYADSTDVTFLSVG